MGGGKVMSKKEELTSFWILCVRTDKKFEGKEIAMMMMTTEEEKGGKGIWN